MRSRKTKRLFGMAAGTFLAATASSAAPPSPYQMVGMGTDKPGPSPVAINAAQPDTLPPPRAVADNEKQLPPSNTKGAAPPMEQPYAPPAHPSAPSGRVGYPACLGIPSEFEPTPFGQSVNAHIRNQVVNGEAARMVLYHYDFVDGAPLLNLHGLDQLARIAGLLGHNGFPIIIERTPCNPALAEARKLAVLAELGRGQCALPPERIIIGPPISNGLRGVEAEVIYQNLISQTHDRGLVTGGASGFVGAATSPGSGGGAGAGGGGGGAGTPSTPH
jgi:hypothetical protein